MKKLWIRAVAILALLQAGWAGAQTNGSAWQEKTIRLATGIQLEYVEQGNQQGVPVILLHGITDSWHSFETTLPHLPPSIHAFALSQRGHGNSERPARGYKPENFAADVAAFIIQKKLGPVVIVGHSMGGVNAQEFALRYPNLTKALVIICSDPSFQKNKGMPEFVAEVMAMKEPFSRTYITDFQRATLSVPIDSSYFNLIVNESMKVPLRVFQQALTGLMEKDYSAELKKIRVPSLVVWGDQDSFCLRQGQEVFAKNLARTTWVAYENTGHALHWEQPKRFALDLTAFIQKHVTNPAVK